MVLVSDLTRQKGESEQMFHRLIVYATTGEKDYTRTAEVLNEEKRKNGNSGSLHNKISVKSVYNTAEKWDWNRRILEAELEAILRDEKELDERYKKRNLKIVETLETIMDFVDEKFKRLKNNDDGYKTSTQINMAYTSMCTLDKAIYNYRLCCGRSTDNKEHHHMGAVAVGSEPSLKYTAAEMKRIQETSSEPDQEIQEFLDQL